MSCGEQARSHSPSFSRFSCQNSTKNRLNIFVALGSMHVSSVATALARSRPLPPPPLRRSGGALASILHDCTRLVHVNLGWNDLRRGGGFPLASAALLQPGRLVSLELSFNGLADDVGVRSQSACAACSIASAVYSSYFCRATAGC